MEIKKKIFNDPLYGLISFPFGIIYQLLDHKYFQRLRRIRQLGLSSYVYTGASHSRFHHSIGVAHLANSLITILKQKDVTITEEEHKAVVIAALLHDVGHGPFSHVLEHLIINQRHESLSLEIMKRLNKEFDGELDLAIKIFEGKYERAFFLQMISGQLDVDRLDYLTRDSFYTGVVEGQVGYNRILKMLNVVDDRLVVEEKGIYSVEKFLMARRFMYKQVYLHKVVLILDEMLKGFLSRYVDLYSSNLLARKNRFTEILDINLRRNSADLIGLYLEIDDIDIFQMLKDEMFGEDFILSYLSSSLLNRNLFTIEFTENPMPSDFVDEVRQKCAESLNINISLSKYIVRPGSIKSLTYNSEDEIEVLTKRREVRPISLFAKSLELNFAEKVYYLCQAKNIV